MIETQNTGDTCKENLTANLVTRNKISQPLPIDEAYIKSSTKWPKRITLQEKGSNLMTNLWTYIVWVFVFWDSSIFNWDNCRRQRIHDYISITEGAPRLCWMRYRRQAEIGRRMQFWTYHDRPQHNIRKNILIWHICQLLARDPSESLRKLDSWYSSHSYCPSYECGEWYLPRANHQYFCQMHIVCACDK